MIEGVILVWRHFGTAHFFIPTPHSDDHFDNHPEDCLKRAFRKLYNSAFLKNDKNKMVIGVWGEMIAFRTIGYWGVGLLGCGAFYNSGYWGVGRPTTRSHNVHHGAPW